MNHYSEAGDIDLMLAVQNDEMEAFNEIVNRYKNRIINFIYRYVMDYHTAEDLTQETFIRLYLSRKRYQPTASFSTFIYTIAVNLAKTELKKKSKWKFIPISKVKDDGEEFYKEFFFAHRDTEKEISGTFTKEAVLKCLESVNDQFKQALVLRDIDGLSYDEISEILNVPKGTVKSRINRGRLQLRKKLKKLSQA